MSAPSSHKGNVIPLSYKASIHLMKVRVAKAQAIETERRVALWKKLKPLISNEKDSKKVEDVLCPKNVSPRYW